MDKIGRVTNNNSAFDDTSCREQDNYGVMEDSWLSKQMNGTSWPRIKIWWGRVRKDRNRATGPCNRFWLELYYIGAPLSWPYKDILATQSTAGNVTGNRYWGRTGPGSFSKWSLNMQAQSWVVSPHSLSPGFWWQGWMAQMCNLHIKQLWLRRPFMKDWLSEITYWKSKFLWAGSNCYHC